MLMNCSLTEICQKSLKNKGEKMCYNTVNKTCNKEFNMAVYYTKEEMIGITELAKSLNFFIKQLKNQTIDKIAIMKNNRPEAVVIPIERYEALEEIEKIVEQISIAETINKRVHNGNSDNSFDYESYRKKRLERMQNV